VGYCRRRPTQGAQAFSNLFSGEERPPGIPILLIFPVSCAKPSSQTHLKLFGHFLLTNF